MTTQTTPTFLPGVHQEPYETYAWPRSKSRRKELAREIRSTLGSSHEAAPHAYRALLAANKLQALIDLATGGKYGLCLVNLREIAQAQAQAKRDGTPYVLPTTTISEGIALTRAASLGGRVQL